MSTCCKSWEKFCFSLGETGGGSVDLTLGLERGRFAQSTSSAIGAFPPLIQRNTPKNRNSIPPKAAQNWLDNRSQGSVVASGAAVTRKATELGSGVTASLLGAKSVWDEISGD
jgi:hypothetical protein